MRRRSRSSRSCHPMEYVEAIREASPEARAWCSSTPTPRCRPAASRRRCARSAAACCAVDEVMSRQGAQRLRRRAPARPSRRDRAADGLLPVQQRGDRGALRAEQARRRARRDRRFRRASRQRLAGHFLGGQERDVLLDARDAALSRHRRDRRARRVQHHRQRAAVAPATAATHFREAFESAILPRLRDIQAGPAGDLGRLRRAYARPARQSQSGGSGLHLGDAEADGDRRRRARKAASSRCWKAATTCKACRARSPRTSPR